MELASRGVGGAARQAARFPGRMPHSARSLHTTPLGRTKAPIPNISSLSQRLLSQTRSALNQFLGHLTAPALRSNVATTSVRSIHVRPAAIQDRLSLAARTKVQSLQGMRTGGPFFPRAPAVPGRSVTQVGLGSARNFTTGRAVFQNLVDNVPVKGRALCEIDWDNKAVQRRTGHRRSGKKENKSRKASNIAEKSRMLVVPAVKNTAVNEDSEIEHYFPAPSVKPVTSYLLIPLAPTPTQRSPLPPNAPDEPPLLRSALSAIGAAHRNHELHSLRVSTLFARLDAANVWAQGVQCSSYALPSLVGEGVCSILKVQFKGWTATEVRAAIGESGSGWCSLEEYNTEEEDCLSDSEDSLIEDGVGPTFAPSQSFVLPTLDFSASSGLPSTLTSVSGMSSPSSDASWSDSDLDSSFSFSDLGL